jgi:hypothetical protein
MKVVKLLCLFGFTFLSANSQKQISREATKEFSTVLNFQFKYGDEFIRTQISYSLRRVRYDYDHAVVIVENLSKNIAYRDTMLKCIFNQYKTRREIRNFLNDIGVSNIYAAEIADYSFEKFNK